jgi:(2R)-ethylmalonyl-CoA mutase
MLAERQRQIEAGEIMQIGVNIFTGEIGLAPPSTAGDSRDYAAEARARVNSLRAWRETRDQSAVAAARESLDHAVRHQLSPMEPTLELARAGGTVGEWTATIERAGRGRYMPPLLDRSGSFTKFQLPHINRKIRIALGKAGLDGHINAVKLLAQACMQAGMEVILAGFKQTPAQLVATALQEDAGVLAISSLAGAHLAIAREVHTELEQHGALDVKVVMGGIIPEQDRKELAKFGVHAVFTPKDSNLAAIVQRIIEIAE